MLDYLPNHVLLQIIAPLDYKTLKELRLLNGRFNYLVGFFLSSYQKITLEPLYTSIPIKSEVQCLRFFVSKKGFIVQVKFIPIESPDPIITHHSLNAGLTLFVNACVNRRPWLVKVNTDGLKHNFGQLTKRLKRKRPIECEKLEIKSNCSKKIYDLSSHFICSAYKIRGPICDSGETIKLHKNVIKCRESLILDQSLTDIQGIDVKELFTWETNMTMEQLKEWIRTKTKDYAGMLYHINVETDDKIDIPKVVNEETKKLYPKGEQISFNDYTATMCKVKRQTETDNGKILTTVNLRYHKMTTTAPWFSYKSTIY